MQQNIAKGKHRGQRNILGCLSASAWLCLTTLNLPNVLLSIDNNSRGSKTPYSLKLTCLLGHLIINESMSSGLELLHLYKLYLLSHNIWIIIFKMRPHPRGPKWCLISSKQINNCLSSSVRHRKHQWCQHYCSHLSTKLLDLQMSSCQISKLG